MEDASVKGINREIVTTLLETNAVDFDAIGSALAKYGRRAAVEWDGEDVFCLTMKVFVRVFQPTPFRTPWPPFGGELEDLGKLREALGGELTG